MDAETDIRKFQVTRNISDFQKGMLRILEDLWNDQENYVKTLSKFFDDDDGVMDSFNPLREEKAAYVRKRILDLGGDCLRAVQENMKGM
tara:strand:+ start:742 stop:1008 length:267 start_codon:yes stop_codon:yes gene_type:complete